MKMNEKINGLGNIDILTGSSRKIVMNDNLNNIDGCSFSPKAIGRNLAMAKNRYLALNSRTKLTHKDICKKVGIHHTQLSHFESGRRVPSLKVFISLCTLYNADPAEILEVKNELGGILTTETIDNEIEEYKQNKQSSNKVMESPILA